MMFLKYAFGPAILAFVTIIPTYIFNLAAKDRFLRAYQDTALLQTSKLDLWDTSEQTSVQMREEYRQWLVDCHKASFIPICLAGVDNFLTAEPAVVVPAANDMDAPNFLEDLEEASPVGPRRRANTAPEVKTTNQRGATFSRMSSVDELGVSLLRKPVTDHDVVFD
jgi:hypothetical protein